MLLFLTHYFCGISAHSTHSSHLILSHAVRAHRINNTALPLVLDFLDITIEQTTNCNNIFIYYPKQPNHLLAEASRRKRRQMSKLIEE